MEILRWVAEPLPAVVEEEEEYPEGPESALDWIELYNHGAEPVALLDWSMTDNRNNRENGSSRDVTIPPMAIFAIIGDGANLTSNLNGYPAHEFPLDRDGEYIGLLTVTARSWKSLSPVIRANPIP